MMSLTIDRVGVGDSSMSCKIPLILSSFDTDLQIKIVKSLNLELHFVF